MSPGSSDSLRFRWLDAIVGKEHQLGPKGSTVRHAALTLAAFMDDAGTCWPSLSMLAVAMQKHRSNVVRALDGLEDQGWITRKRGTRGKSTVYRAVIPVVAPAHTGSRASATEVVAPAHTGSRASATEVVAPAHLDSRASATRTPQEHANERSREAKKGDSILNYPFPTEVSEAFILTRGRRAQAEDFPTLKAVALELQASYPAETIVEAVKSLGRSDDPPEALLTYVEAVAA